MNRRIGSPLTEALLPARLLQDRREELAGDLTLQDALAILGEDRNVLDGHPPVPAWTERNGLWGVLIGQGSRGNRKRISHSSATLGSGRAVSDGLMPATHRF